MSGFSAAVRVALAVGVAAVVAAGVGVYLAWRGSPGPVGPVRLERTLSVHRLDWLGPLAFTPDGSALAAAGMRTAYLFDPGTGRRRATWTAPPGAELTSLAFTPDGTTLAGASDDSGITYLFDTAARRVSAVLRDPSFGGGISPLAFSPDGTTRAIGDGMFSQGRHHGHIALWSVARHQIRTLLRGPRRAVSSLAFSPDGSSQAATGLGRVYLWDLATGQRVATLTGPAGAIASSVAFSPDGRIVTAIFTNNSAYLWNVQTRTVAAVCPTPAVPKSPRLPTAPATRPSPSATTTATSSCGTSPKRIPR